MPVSAVICDWNGTIIHYRNEKPLLNYIGVELFKSCLPFRIARMKHILSAKKRMELIETMDHNGHYTDPVREVFKVYNEEIIRGVPVPFINRAVEKYARKPKTQRKLDRRILESVKLCYENGKTTGILSAGYGYGINMILKESGYERYFHFCKADTLTQENGYALEFGLSIYGSKHECLDRIMAERKLDPAQVAYIGDSEDDAVCLSMVGYPVVPFFAPPELKESFSRKYNAFVPADGGDLHNYLLKG
jgi:phosphoserine phosphatase